MKKTNAAGVDMSWYLQFSEPGNASNYIRHFHAIHDLRGRPVVFWCRVSTHKQYDAGNNVDQEENLRQVVTTYECPIIDVFHHVGSGWEEADTWRIVDACRCAEKHNAILLAETTDRFRRHHAYHSKKNPTARATGIELMGLKCRGWRTVFATDLHPDATFEEVRSYQTKRGKDAKGNAGGRPPNTAPGDVKRRREEMTPHVLEMHAAGLSLRDIEAELGVPFNTARRWIEKSS